jgi:hypothetical protein
VSKNLLKRAKKWRGIRLLSNPEKSAKYIIWCIKEGVFAKMMEFEEY